MTDDREEPELKHASDSAAPSAQSKEKPKVLRHSLRSTGNAIERSRALIEALSKLLKTG